MAPSRRTIKKKMNKKKKKIHDQDSDSDSFKLCSNDSVLINVDEISSSSTGCTTPKAQKYRIPEVLTCPPAPKKRKLVSSSFTLRRTPISFFDPPDIELFFASHLASIYI
ncbi:hypothetical protein R6Q57_017061 [Mikania cordata]